MLKVEVSSKNLGVIATESIEEEESPFYEFIGKQLLKVAPQVPDYVTVNINDGAYQCKYSCAQRGSFTKNGEKIPSMFVREDKNNVNDILKFSSYDDRYLTCVNPESNNYKFYHLKPNDKGVNVSYGRIGTKQGEQYGAKDVEVPYEHHMFWIRYFEKLSKGYIDQTDIYLPKSTNNKGRKTKKANSTITEKICQFFKKVSRQYVESQCVSATVSEKQYKESEKLLGKLRNSKTVDEFNGYLMSLFSICPRRVAKVNQLLATDTSDMSEIIDREERLVKAMQALVGGTSGESFKSYGVSIYNATDKQKEEVMRHLSDNLKAKVKNIYRVIDNDRKNSFAKYLKANNIKKVKQFWHGSKTENWYSIIINSLQLHPNASITGKMFGHGIYFAPSSEKSFKYTSYRGSYWAKGHDDSGFLGLYAVAYGNPYDVYTAQSGMTESRIKSLGKDSLHAHAGSALYNDEVVIYNENACILNYLVELGD